MVQSSGRIDGLRNRTLSNDPQLLSGTALAAGLWCQSGFSWRFFRVASCSGRFDFCNAALRRQKKAVIGRSRAGNLLDRTCIRIPIFDGGRTSSDEKPQVLTCPVSQTSALEKFLVRMNRSVTPPGSEVIVCPPIRNWRGANQNLYQAERRSFGNGCLAFE